MNQNKLVILSGGACSVPDSMRNQHGELAIIIPESQAPQINIREKELSRFEAIISGYSDSFTMYFGPEAQQIFEHPELATRTNNVRRFRGYYEVQGFIILDGYIYVTSTEEKTRDGFVKYQVQVIGTHQEWKTLIKDFPVCEATYSNDQFTWNWANILDLMQTNDAYVDGNPIFYPLVADFGQFWGNGAIALQDVRLSTHIWPMIEAAYCAKGWKVKSRFFQSKFGRSIGGYHAPEKFPEEAYVFKNKRFYTISRNKDLYTGIDGDTTVIPFDVDTAPPAEVYDIGDVFRTDAGIDHPHSFINDSDGDVKIRFHYDLTFKVKQFGGRPGGPTLQRRVKLDALYGLDDPGSTQDFLPIITSSISINTIHLQGHFDMIVPAGNYVQLAWSSIDQRGDGAGTYFEQGDWYNERIGNEILEGDIIQVSKTIDKELTIDDMMIDLGVLFNLGFRTMRGQKVVEIEPMPARYQVPAEFHDKLQTLRGYQYPVDIPNGTWEITENLNIEQAVIKDLKVQDTPESTLYKFKDSSDGHPNYEEYTDEAPPLSYRQINQGIGDEKKIELKVYEPTLATFIDRMSVSGGSAPWMSLMWANDPENDNEIPEQGYKIGKRILYHFGWLEQYRTMADSAAVMTMNGTDYTNIPTVAQYCNAYLFGDRIEALSPIKPNVFLEFGENSNEFGLFDVFTRQMSLQEFGAVQIEMQAQLSMLKLANWVPGKLLHLNFEQAKQSQLSGYYRLIEMIYSTNGSNELVIQAAPMAPIVQDCTFTPEVVEECDATPILDSAEVWVDATDIQGNGSPTADGTNIPQWRDKTSNANDFLQIASEPVPIKFTDGAREIVEFSDKQLETARAPFGQRTGIFEIYIVMKTRTGAGSGFTLSTDAASGEIGFQVPANGGAFAAYLGDEIESISWPGSYSDYHIYGFRFKGLPRPGATPNFFSARIDGSEFLYNANPNLNQIDAQNEMILGRRHTGSNHQQINVCELVIFRRHLTDQERDCLENHFSSKWSIDID